MWADLPRCQYRAWRSKRVGSYLAVRVLQRRDLGSWYQHTHESVPVYAEIRTIVRPNQYLRGHE
eukprot:2502350-Rhodomonas_salina.6